MHVTFLSSSTLFPPFHFASLPRALTPRRLPFPLRTQRALSTSTNLRFPIRHLPTLAHAPTPAPIPSSPSFPPSPSPQPPPSTIPSSLPNLLTSLRLLFTPLLLLLALHPLSAPHRLLHAALFLLLSLTDLLDGHLARRHNLTSAFGAFLDPVADKLLVAAALLALLLRPSPSPSPLLLPALAAAILLRELAVSALRNYMARREAAHVVAVAPAGKLKTATQMAALTLLLATAPGHPAFALGLALLALAAALTIASALTYFRAARQALAAGPLNATGSVQEKGR